MTHAYALAAALAAVAVSAASMWAYGSKRVADLTASGIPATRRAESATPIIWALVILAGVAWLLVYVFGNDAGEVATTSVIGIALFMVFLTTSGLEDYLEVVTPEHEVATWTSADDDDDDGEADAPGARKGMVEITSVEADSEGIVVKATIDDVDVALRGQIARDFLAQYAAGDDPEYREHAFTVAEDGTVTSFRADHA